MKAIITRGKNKGVEVEISQWCNDWFTVNTGTNLDCRPLSLSSLAFTLKGAEEITNNDDNGTLFEEFKIVPISGFGKYKFSFRKLALKEMRKFSEGEPDEDVVNWQRGER